MHVPRGVVILLACSFGTLVQGCEASVLSPRQWRELRHARDLWTSAGGPDYTVESRIGCFCPPHLNYWTRLTVREDRVVSAEPVEPLPDGFEPSTLGWKTVDELFTAIESLDPGYVRSVTLRFDPALGYPLEASVTCQPNIADCGVIYEMRNLRIPGV